MATEVVEAPSRPDVFAVLKRRGILAVRVSEASGRDVARQMGKGKAGISKTRLLVWAAVGIVAAVGALIATRLLPGGEQGKDGVPVRRTGRVSVIPSTGDGMRKKGESAPNGQPSEASAEVNGTVAVAESAAQNGDGQKAEVEETPPKKRVFEHGTDQLIAMATSAPEGGLIPPLPAIGAAETDEFIASLSKPIVIDDDDTDAVKDVKRRVQAVRADIAKALAENPGKEISDILNEHREIFNDNSKIRAGIMVELERILNEEGDVAGAKKYRDTMNYALQQMGIKEIDMPVTEEERNAAAEQGEQKEEEGK